MSRRHLRVFFSSLVLCATGLAQAQVTGGSSLEDLRFTLTDLSPDDGITPSLTWTDDGVTRVLIYGGPLIEYEGGGFNTGDGGLYQNIEAAGGWGDVFKGGNDQYSVGMGTQGLNASFNAPFGIEYAGMAVNNRHFTLTPNTSLTFQAKAKAGVETDIPQHGEHASAAYPFVPDVDARFRGYLYLTLDGGMTAFSELAPEVEFLHTDIGLNSAFEQDLLFVTLTNKGPYAVNGALSALADFRVHTRPLPVPEPAAWAQMVCGLAVLGGLSILRRPRRQARVA